MHYANYKRVAISYTELEFDKSMRRVKRPVNLIFKAVNQLMKFISYHSQRIKNTNLKGWRSMPFYFYFPVVLFDGKMYEYSEKSGRKYLKPVKRVLLESSHYPSHHYRDVPFGIDIVTKEAFEELLTNIEKDCLTIYAGIIGAKQKLMAEYSHFLPQDVLKEALLKAAERKKQIPKTKQKGT